MISIIGGIFLAVFILFLMLKASQLAILAGGHDTAASDSDRMIADIIIALSGTGTYFFLFG